MQMKSVERFEIVAIGVILALIFLATDVRAQGWEHKGEIDNEINCLTENIYFEARGESTRGQLWVAHVTWNRVHSDNYPNSICKVVWFKKKNKYGKWIPHFSWTLDGKSDKIVNQEAYDAARKVALKIISGRSKDPTKGATHYHADYVNPYWADSLTKLATIDNHIFYR